MIRPRRLTSRLAEGTVGAMRPFPIAARRLDEAIPPIPLWSDYGRKPAASPFKAALRAAGRSKPPGSAGWACVLRKSLSALLVRTLRPARSSGPGP